MSRRDSPPDHNSFEPQPPRREGLVKRVTKDVSRAALNWYRNPERPTLLDMGINTYAKILPAVFAVGIAVGRVDSAVGTEFADKLASVEVMPDSNVVYQTGQTLVQTVGKIAGGETLPPSESGR